MLAKPHELCTVCQLFTKAKTVCFEDTSCTEKKHMWLDESPETSLKATGSIPRSIREVAEARCKYDMVESSDLDRPVLLHKTLSDLEKTASSQDCHLCSLIYERIKTSNADDVEKVFASDVRVVLYLQFGEFSSRYRMSAMIRICLMEVQPQKDRDTRPIIKLLDTVGLVVWRPGRVIQFETQEGICDGTALLLKRRRVPSRLDDNSFVRYHEDECVQQLRRSTLWRLQDWLHDCNAGTHDGCLAITGDIPLPARLLQLEQQTDDFFVRLVETTELTIPSLTRYATLSHCWGNVMPVRLLQSNYTCWKQGFGSSVLPKTFREAIIVCAALNLRYVWIDALCIIQDSEHDWLKEAPLMCNIYAGSCVTLAAAAAQNCLGGLFCQDPFLAPCAVQFNSDGVLSGLHVIQPNPLRMFIEDSPLNQRAWAFQERILSPRRIYFTNREIVWSCSSCLYTESMAESNVGADQEDRRIFLEGADLKYLTRLYSQKQLTCSTDRLVAFSGVAEVFYSRMGLLPTDYLAGLSRKTIQDDLLWTRSLTARTAIQLPKFAGPSWSWASNSDPVTWAMVEKGSNDPVICNKSFALISVNIQRRSPNPFGSIHSAQARIAALLLKVLALDESQLTVRGPKGEDCTLIYLKTVFDLGSGHSNSMRQAHKLTGEWKVTHAVAVAQQVYCDHSPVFGLLLLARAGGQRGVYRRSDMWKTGGDIHELPPWWEEGSRLDEAEYLQDLGGGRYEIELI